MSSIRKAPLGALAVAALAAAALSGGGCANGVRPEPIVEASEPMVVDEAMQARDWDASVAYYPNGDTIGGIDRAPIKPRFIPSDPYVQGGAAPFLFIAQALAAPVSFLWAPPFEPVATQGEVFRPTYTGAPPLPADQPTPEQAAEQRRERHERLRRERQEKYADRDLVEQHGRGVFPDRRAPRPEGEEEQAPEEGAVPAPAEGVPMEPAPAQPAPSDVTPPPAQTEAPAQAAPEPRRMGPGAPDQAPPNEAVPAQPPQAGDTNPPGDATADRPVMNK